MTLYGWVAGTYMLTVRRLNVWRSFVHAKSPPPPVMERGIEYIVRILGNLKTKINEESGDPHGCRKPPLL